MIRHPTTTVWWLWPGVVLLSAIATIYATFVQITTPLRPALTLWFLLVCPGMAVVHWLGVWDSARRWTLAIALSLALNTIVATAMLYAGVWQPALILLIIACLTVGVLSAQALVMLTSKALRAIARQPVPLPRSTAAMSLFCALCFGSACYIGLAQFAPVRTQFEAAPHISKNETASVTNDQQDFLASPEGKRARFVVELTTILSLITGLTAREVIRALDRPWSRRGMRWLSIILTPVFILFVIIILYRLLDLLRII